MMFGSPSLLTSKVHLGGLSSSQDDRGSLHLEVGFSNTFSSSPFCLKARLPLDFTLSPLLPPSVRGLVRCKKKRSHSVVLSPNTPFQIMCYVNRTQVVSRIDQAMNYNLQNEVSTTPYTYHWGYKMKGSVLIVYQTDPEQGYLQKTHLTLRFSNDRTIEHRRSDFVDYKWNSKTLEVESITLVCVCVRVCMWVYVLSKSLKVTEGKTKFYSTVWYIFSVNIPDTGRFICSLERVSHQDRTFRLFYSVSIGFCRVYNKNVIKWWINLTALLLVDGR